MRPSLRCLTVALTVLCSSSWSCSLETVSYGGKSCPSGSCPEGYFCDERAVCQPGDAPGTGGSGGTSTATTGMGGAGCGDGVHPPLATLVDDFDDGSISDAFIPHTIPVQCISETDGELVAMPLADGHTCIVDTVFYYDLSCSSVTFRVTDTVGPILGAQTFIAIWPKDEAQFPARKLLLEGGGFFVIIAGQEQLPPQQLGPHDPLVDLWWRLRGAGDAVVFETWDGEGDPNDATVWEAKGDPIQMGGLEATGLTLGALQHAALSDPVGATRFDCLNVPPALCP